MASIARGDSSNCTTPILDVYFSVNGVLTDVSELSFQVFDVSTPLKQVTPLQIYPTTVGQRAVVDVAVTCPTVGAGKLSAGRYVGTWTVPANEPLGTHMVKWFFKLTPSSVEQSFQEEFEVLIATAASADDVYALVQDLRDEGVTTTIADDVLLSKRIQLASRFIEKATGQWFSPRTLSLTLDGRGGPMLLLNIPIIAVSAVEFDSSPWSPASLPVDLTMLRIYNRHLTQRLTAPDDRENPKLEIFHPQSFNRNDSPYNLSSLVFPRGQQNVLVDGVFGYTEWDQNLSTGVTPELIRHVCKLIVMRELPKLVDVGARSEAQERFRLTSERTRDQSYTLEPLGARAGALFTGDPVIDRILASFMRLPSLGAV